MSHNLEDVDLSGDSLYVVNVDDLLLLEHLDGHFLSREAVGPDHHLAESSFTQITPKDVVAHYLALVGVLLGWLFFSARLRLRSLRSLSCCSLPIGLFLLCSLLSSILLLKVNHGQFSVSLCSLCWSWRDQLRIYDFRLIGWCFLPTVSITTQRVKNVLLFRDLWLLGLKLIGSC